MEAANRSPPSLRKGELKALELFRDGLACWEIAARLNVSQTTVDTNLMAIRRKLGVSKISAIVAKAIELGLIERR